MMMSSRGPERRRRCIHNRHHDHQLLVLTRIFLLICLTFIIGDVMKCALAQHSGIVIGGRQHDFGIPMLGGRNSNNKKKNTNNNGGGGRQQSTDDNPSNTGGGVDAIAISDDGSVPIGGGRRDGEEILTQKSLQMSMQEPTCDELRAMWRFSKRQSRAAEITNEIPTYRDPFAYNIWDPLYARSRGLDGLRTRPAHLNGRGPPIYGRVIHREQERLLPYQVLVRPPAGGDDFNRFYGGANNGGGGGEGVSLSSPYGYMQRKYPKLRFSSGGGGGGGGGVGGVADTSGTVSNPNGIAIHQGSFQKLKNLIWTERAKELRDQRRAEELAARIAVLKEIANGQSFNVGPNEQQQQQQQQQQHYKTDSLLMDENRSPDHDRYHHMTNSRLSIIDGQLPKVIIEDDNGHRKHRPQIHSSSSTIFSSNPISKSERHNPKLILPQMDNFNNRMENNRKFEFKINGMNGRNGSLGKLETGADGGDNENGKEDGGKGEKGEAANGYKGGLASFSPTKLSHFRERSRELQKQGLTSPAFYHRSTRNFYNKLFNNEPQNKLMKYDDDDDADADADADYAGDISDIDPNPIIINDYDYNLNDLNAAIDDYDNDYYDRNQINRFIDLYEANDNNNNNNNDNIDGNINGNNYPNDDGRLDLIKTIGLQQLWDDLYERNYFRQQQQQQQQQQQFDDGQGQGLIIPANDFNNFY